MASIEYRPEIDGLRALAVVSVVLFHAEVPGFPGGFIGVDVFFVISGYLMSALVIEELEAGRFNLLGFFERRARRILPMLLLVTIVCIPIAFLTMLPDPLENFGQSVVASILFSNNILLNVTAGYWELAAEFKPLLHTWSLAIEEQFYILFPLLCILLFRLGGALLKLSLAVLAILSLGAYLDLQRTSPDSAFYLLHTRTWELLAGVLLRLFTKNNRLSAQGLLAAIGMVILGLPLILVELQMIRVSVATCMAVAG